MKNNLPIIGISLDSSKEKTFSNYPWYALRINYVDIIAKYGAIPILLPHNPEMTEHYANLIDGLLIPGGDDHLDPKLYGEEPTRDYKNHNARRTEFETALIEKLIKSDKPILGICAGMQLMAVQFAKGSLIQDVHLAELKNSCHQQKNLGIPVNLPIHPIFIEENTKLREILGVSECQVNSAHEQAVKKISSEDFIISARAPDGIIEAIEHKSHKFMIGIEWHPEFICSSSDENIFIAFIKAASNTDR